MFHRYVYKSVIILISVRKLWITYTEFSNGNNTIHASILLYVHGMTTLISPPCVFFANNFF